MQYDEMIYTLEKRALPYLPDNSDGIVREAVMQATEVIPVLYEALKMAVRVLQDNDIDTAMAGEFEILTDALAKAEGG